MGRRPAPCGTYTRYKRGCRCDACVGAYRTWYEANKQRIKERVATWQKANPEKVKVHTARHRDKNREKRRADALARYRRLMAEDPERVRAQRRKWAKTEKGAMQNRLARHRRRGAAPTTTAKVYAEILLSDPCSYCGSPGGEIDHLDPITSGGNGDWLNLTSACRRCNASKNDRSLLVFLAA